jgi:hypothetical protein
MYQDGQPEKAIEYQKIIFSLDIDNICIIWLPQLNLQFLRGMGGIQSC